MILNTLFKSNALLTTEGVAKRLVQLCRENKRVDAIDELYSDKITSIELKGERRSINEGKLAIARKLYEWNAAVELIFDLHVSDPVISGEFFSCSMRIDALINGEGRVKIDTLCVYKVQYGKIVFEQYFFSEELVGTTRNTKRSSISF